MTAPLPGLGPSRLPSARPMSSNSSMALLPTRSVRPLRRSCAFAGPRAGRRGLGRLVGAGLRSERDADAVPGVDRGDGPGEVRKFLVGEMATDCVVDGLGDVSVGHVGEGFGPFQS